MLEEYLETSNFHKVALKTQWGGREVCLPHTDDATLTTTTTEVQSGMLFFNSPDVKCQHSNPITGGIFRGCTVSILKNGEVIYRSYFEQLLS